MTAPTPNNQNVIVSEANCYWAPAPLRVPEPPVADTVAYDTLWTGNWVFIGGTTGGVDYSVDRKTVTITGEEQSNPIDVLTDTTALLVSATLHEETVANMKLALGGGTITVTAPGSTQVGKSTLRLSDTMDFLSVGFEGLNADGFWTRFYVPLVKSTGKQDIKFRRAKAEHMWLMEMTALCATSDLVIDVMTAVHT